MHITLVFDNTGSEDIGGNHILELNFKKLERCLQHKFRNLKHKEVYECKTCDVVICNVANKSTRPDIPILTRLAETTVFENIMSNTIQMIEIVDDRHHRVIYMPSRLESGENRWQRFHIDDSNNLHIRCSKQR